MTTITVSGVTSSFLTISGAGNELIVLSGGEALSTTVEAGATLIVSSGGVASFTNVSSGAFLMARRLRSMIRCSAPASIQSKPTVSGNGAGPMARPSWPFPRVGAWFCR